MNNQIFEQWEYYREEASAKSLKKIQGLCKGHFSPALGMLSNLLYNSSYEAMSNLEELLPFLNGDDIVVNECDFTNDNLKFTRYTMTYVIPEEWRFDDRETTPLSLYMVQGKFGDLIYAVSNDKMKRYYCTARIDDKFVMKSPFHLYRAWLLYEAEPALFKGLKCNIPVGENIKMVRFRCPSIYVSNPELYPSRNPHNTAGEILYARLIDVTNDEHLKTGELGIPNTYLIDRYDYNPKFINDGVFNILYKETPSGTICAVDYSTTSPYIYDECKAKNPLNEEAVIDFEKDYMFNRVCIPPYRHDLIKYASRGTVLFEVPWSDHRKCKSLSKEYDYINRIFFGIKKNKEGIYDVNVMYNWENRRINYE